MMANRELLSTEELHLLQRRAQAVTEPAVFGDKAAPLAAREIASRLGSLVRQLANTYGHAEMRAACAWLAGRPWPTGSLRCNLRDPLLALAKHIADSRGQVNVRDALAFWASETDPAVWQGVIGVPS